VARGEKADQLKSTYASYGERVEVVKITDIAHDQFPEALAGVDAIIHIATPAPGRAEPSAMLAVCHIVFTLLFFAIKCSDCR
jgi:hypothetical protein